MIQVLTANISSQISKSMPGERTSSTEIELEEGQDPPKDSDRRSRSARKFRKPDGNENVKTAAC